MHTTSKKQYLERSFNILSSPVPFITKLYGEWLVTCLRIVNTKMNGFSKLQHTSSGIYHGISNMSILSHYIVKSHQQVLGYIMLNPYEIPVGESPPFPPFPWIPLRTSSKATICRPTSSGWKKSPYLHRDEINPGYKMIKVVPSLLIGGTVPCIKRNITILGTPHIDKLHV